MNQEPQHDARAGASRDGLAAVAILVLTILVIVLVVSAIV